MERRSGMSFKKNKDLILGVMMMLLSAFYLYFAFQIKTRPKLTPAYSSAQIVPILLGIVLAAMSVILIIQGIRKRLIVTQDEQKKMAGSDVAAVALTFAVIIGYTLVMQPLGFCLSTVIYLFLQMLVLAPKAKRNYLLFAGISVVFTAIVFVAFRMGLQQLLPRGIIESLLGF